MKKIWPMLLLGLAAYLLFAVVTLPAQLLASRLVGQGVILSGVQGTVWGGRAEILQVAGTNIGTLEWDFRPLALFMAQLRADVKVGRPDGELSGQIDVQPFSGRITIGKLNGALPLSALPASVTQGTREGTLRANFSELVIEKGFPSVAKGTVQALNVVMPRNPTSIGSFEVKFPAAQPVPNTLSGDLSSIEGPLRVVAVLQLKAADRSFLVEGTIGTQPNTPPEINRMLQYMGTPDAQGNRPFTVAGTM